MVDVTIRLNCKLERSLDCRWCCWRHIGFAESYRDCNCSWDSFWKGNRGDEGLYSCIVAQSCGFLAAGITAATIALVKHSKKECRVQQVSDSWRDDQRGANDRLRELNKNIKELEERKEKAGNNRLLQSLTRQLRIAKAAAKDLELAMKLASSYTVSGITV